MDIAVNEKDIRAQERLRAEQQDIQNLANDKAMQEAFLKHKQNNTTSQELQTKYNKDDYIFANDSNTTSDTKQDNPQDTQFTTQEKETLGIINEVANHKYRNTGISYFDDRENLSLKDAFLANVLGADIRRIDVNLNANVKKTDVSKAKGELASLFSDTQVLFDSIDHYEDTYQKQKDSYLPFANFFASTGRKINNLTNGFINFSDNANEKILSNNTRDAYITASLMAGGAGKRTNQNIKDAKTVIDNTWKGRENYYAGIKSTLESGTANINEKISSMQDMGIPISQSDLLKMQFINDMNVMLGMAQNGEKLNNDFKKRKQALQILQQKGDVGISEALMTILK